MARPGTVDDDELVPEYVLPELLNGVSQPHAR